VPRCWAALLSATATSPPSGHVAKLLADLPAVGGRVGACMRTTASTASKPSLAKLELHRHSHHHTQNVPAVAHGGAEAERGQRRAARLAAETLGGHQRLACVPLGTGSASWRATWAAWPLERRARGMCARGQPVRRWSRPARRRRPSSKRAAALPISVLVVGQLKPAAEVQS
jgi:hypothetical protein